MKICAIRKPKLKKKQKNKKLRIINDWMLVFPCNRYYNGEDCINEYINTEDMYDFIENRSR